VDLEDNPDLEDTADLKGDLTELKVKVLVKTKVKV